MIYIIERWQDMSTESTAPVHENLLDLFQKLKSVGSVANIIAHTLKGVLGPSDKVLICFYQMEMSEEETSQPAMGSCDVTLITNGRYITLGFYPAYHRIEVKEVYKISAFNIQHRFATGYETEGELGNAEERGFSPIEIQLTVFFINQQGELVAEWHQETSRPEDIKTLFKQTQLLSKLSGKPLAEVKLD